MEGMDVKAPRPGCGGADDGAAASLSARREEEGKGAVGGEDEQVERFYALLANIRAMRGMYSQYRDDAAAGDGDGASRRKRARRAEPPWRPAFRMEDFEEVAAGDDGPACSSRTKKQRGGGHGTAVEKRRITEKAAAAAADDDDDDEEEEEAGEVVEVKEHRAAASRPTGPLTSNQLAS
uniref:Uncharacterized protein n=1 Tax=Oryza punctata TaxID=4537 RepID=A0A0E0L1P0_ORYPU